ncbi:MAG: hypothetical protein ACR2PF_18545 [Rhizobiaceae bacterium]
MQLHLRSGELQLTGSTGESIKAQILQKTDFLLNNVTRKNLKEIGKGEIIFIAYYMLGFVIILFFMSINDLNKKNFFLMGVFSGFMGLTTIFLFALFNPYGVPGKVIAESYLSAASYIGSNFLN